MSFLLSYRSYYAQPWWIPLLPYVVATSHCNYYFHNTNTHTTLVLFIPNYFKTNHTQLIHFLSYFLKVYLIVSHAHSWLHRDFKIQQQHANSEKYFNESTAECADNNFFMNLFIKS